MFVIYLSPRYSQQAPFFGEHQSIFQLAPHVSLYRSVLVAACQITRHMGFPTPSLLNCCTGVIFTGVQMNMSDTTLFAVKWARGTRE